MFFRHIYRLFGAHLFESPLPTLKTLSTALANFGLICRFRRFRRFRQIHQLFGTYLSNSSLFPLIILPITLAKFCQIRHFHQIHQLSWGPSSHVFQVWQNFPQMYEFRKYCRQNFIKSANFFAVCMSRLIS